MPEPIHVYLNERAHDAATHDCNCKDRQRHGAGRAHHWKGVRKFDGDEADLTPEQIAQRNEAIKRAALQGALQRAAERRRLKLEGKDMIGDDARISRGRGGSWEVSSNVAGHLGHFNNKEAANAAAAAHNMMYGRKPRGGSEVKRPGSSLRWQESKDQNLRPERVQASQRALAEMEPEEAEEAMESARASGRTFPTSGQRSRAEGGDQGGYWPHAPRPARKPYESSGFRKSGDAPEDPHTRAPGSAAIRGIARPWGGWLGRKMVGESADQIGPERELARRERLGARSAAGLGGEILTDPITPEFLRSPESRGKLAKSAASLAFRAYPRLRETESRDRKGRDSVRDWASYRFPWLDRGYL